MTSFVDFHLQRASMQRERCMVSIWHKCDHREHAVLILSRRGMQMVLKASYRPRQHSLPCLHSIKTASQKQRGKGFRVHSAGGMYNRPRKPLVLTPVEGDFSTYLCRRWKREPRGAHWVMMHKLGGSVQAPMNMMTLGCFIRLFNCTSALNSCTGPN